MSLPLHIFEPRYKRMIAECIEQSSPFGVLLEHEGRRAAIGAAAAVTAVLRRYPDGRLDIASEGRQRFRLLATDDQLPYLRGEVEWMAETDEDAAAERALALAAFGKTRAFGLVQEPGRRPGLRGGTTAEAAPLAATPTRSFPGAWW